MNVQSYRGIFLTSVISKVLELLLLDWLNMVLLEAGLPHINQSVYVKQVSCDDAIFATQEVIAKYVHDGSSVFTYMPV